MDRIMFLNMVLGWLVSVAAFATDQYSPHVERTFPTDVYWGDTHAHTNISTDSVFTSSQADAYRFAQGEEVISISGQPVRLREPLGHPMDASFLEPFDVMPPLQVISIVLKSRPTRSQVFFTCPSIDAILPGSGQPAY